MSGKVGTIFFANIRTAIDEMRKAGLQDATIACIVCDIRAAAIHEERLRAEITTKNNPPHYPTYIEMREAIASFIERPQR